MNGRTILILGGVGLVGSACGTTLLDAGSSLDGGTDGGLRGLPYLGTPSNSFEVKCDVPAPDWLAGTWQGEFDAYTLSSGSKAVRIEFAGANKTAPSPYGSCGTVTFGEGVPPSLATDPKAPPPAGNGSPSSGIIEGFAYEFVSAVASVGEFVTSVDGGMHTRRVQFGITPHQIYKSWCNLQLSYDFASPGHSFADPPIAKVANCLPPSALPRVPRGGHLCEDSGLVVVGASCAQALYCVEVAACDCYPSWSLTPRDGPPAQGCTVTPTGDIKFDLSLADTTLSGNVVLSEGVEGLHLTHVP